MASPLARTAFAAAGGSRGQAAPQRPQVLPNARMEPQARQATAGPGAASASSGLRSGSGGRSCQARVKINAAIEWSRADFGLN